jgi:hypothetical protein
MARTLVARLLVDLRRHARGLADRLSALPTDDERAAHVRDAAERVRTIQGYINELVQDPAIDDERLATNYWATYRRLREGLNQLEWFVVTLLERFGEPDRTISRVLRRLCAQIGWSQRVPLVGAYASDYYSTALGMIYVPASETSSLLGLPDFGHELAHVLLLRVADRAAWRAPFEQALADYIERLRGRLRRDNQDAYLALLPELIRQWRDHWWSEFSADMIATYLMGPAYGWQHVRLCAGRVEAFAPGLDEDEASDHPSDEARFRGICTLLRTLAPSEDRDALEDFWSSYLRASGQMAPPDYDLVYPPELLEPIAANVISRCRALGLRSFDQAASSPDDVVALLNEAWRRFEADPVAYEAWEREALLGLFSSSGAPDSDVVAPAPAPRTPA